MSPSDTLRYTRIALNNGVGAIPALGFGTLIPDPVATRQAIRSALERCAAELGISVLQLGSPASHDAAAFAAAGVPMGMIFVRNENGSHNPREAMEIDDFMAGAALLTQYLVAAYASR